MGKSPPQTPSTERRPSALPRVMVATTAMLTFISFWRAAAIVLNDLASSAFYAGGIAEDAIGKSAPWFILAVMIFAYAVCQMYIESCSMFVRGGVFSVSALMFDYILTGPISGVSAGQYLAGFLNDIAAYIHLDITFPTNTVAMIFAVGVTVYFWWVNTKGIAESGEKAMLIMQLTTVMVVVMIAWCGYTLFLRGGHLPPWPKPSNLRFSNDALGWFRTNRLPEVIGSIGILVAFGHSVLAMSGLETLAQVYRELEHPKLPNLKKTGLIIFIYSLVFTSLVSFFAFAIIPDSVRLTFKNNLISGLAMNVVGPTSLKLIFHAFVVVVGILILAGAVNTAIVGSNGVLNRVSEDGVLTDWFRRPHPRFGTSYRIINLVVGLQILTILLSRGNVIALGAAYAFGVMWSFAMKALAVLVLRYTEPGPREFHVPLNIRIGRLELPLGLGLITLTLFSTAMINLFTKEVATVTGVAFTLVFYALFTISERTYARRGEHQAELDQFCLAPGAELTPQTVGCRPGNILVLVRDYNTLYNVASVLRRVDPQKQDVVVLHLRLLVRAGSGEHALVPEQLFTANEQLMFTRALSLAEKEGKTVHLCLVAANDVFDGILRTAQSLQSSTVVLGTSSKMSVTEEARQVGLAWERLDPPRPTMALEIYTPTGQEHISYLGPHAPHLTSKEIDLLHKLWLECSTELAPEELHHHDIIHFALDELQSELSNNNQKRAEVLDRIRQHLLAIKNRREPHL
ncbi:MAG: APC family permease [Acidobacteria bacterium]|nr:MAG: APC family permease [Acidobacteriota bacterium]